MAGGWAIARLAALLTCVGLTTSRLGLVVHELLGHGATTLAAGGTVTEVRLFYLAGGWLRYRVETPGEAHVVALGGIVIEAVIGLALWFALAGRAGLVGRVVRAVGAALVIHASWYLATGTFHGYGDGVRLHQLLGEARWGVAIGAGAACLAMAYAAARRVLGVLAGTLPGTRRFRIAGVVVAAVLAGGAQLGGAVAEVSLRHDRTYATTMRPERDRVIARELAAWLDHQARAGVAPDARAQGAMRQQLARRHVSFPFAYILAALLVLAIGLGAWRTQIIDEARLPRRVVAGAALAAGGSIALVVALAAALS